jgi:L-amino acid N-acyltransferase YncA
MPDSGGSFYMPCRIDPMTPEDWERVRAIYDEGIATGNATLETELPSWERWDKAHLPLCRMAARSGDEIVGWAALSPVSERCAYGGVAEVSVYVAAAHRGRGIGLALLERLAEESERNGLWTLQGGIFPENESSLAIHRQAGFREVGRRERLGRMGNRWRDMVLMERRSRRVGWE